MDLAHDTDEMDEWMTGASLIEGDVRPAPPASARSVTNPHPTPGVLIGAVAAAAATGIALLLFHASRKIAFREPEEWQTFLDGLTDAPTHLSTRHAKELRDMWTCLRVALGPKLPLPQVEPGDDGAIKLCWSRADYYAEIEILPEDERGRCLHEWFFRDRKADTHDGSTGPESGAPSLRLLGLMRRAIGG